MRTAAHSDSEDVHFMFKQNKRTYDSGNGGWPSPDVSPCFDGVCGLKYFSANFILSLKRLESFLGITPSRLNTTYRNNQNGALNVLFCDFICDSHQFRLRELSLRTLANRKKFNYSLVCYCLLCLCLDLLFYPSCHIAFFSMIGH